MATVPERLSSLETGLENHKTQCVTDKLEIKGRFDSIDNKLWALIIGLLLHFVAIAGYLVTQGTPWESQTIIADRGERK
jgi:hypothetical protein